MNKKAHTACGFTRRARRRRALFAAVFGACGLPSFALAQANERAAVLLPPQAITAPVARGAIEDDPLDKFATTPVTRPGGTNRPAGGPSWLKDADTPTPTASKPTIPTTSVLKPKATLPVAASPIAKPAVPNSTPTTFLKPPVATAPSSKPTASASLSPTWLNGADENVRPAGIKSTTPPLRGTVVNASVRAKPIMDNENSAPIVPEKPSFFNRGLDKLRSAFTSDKPVMSRERAPIVMHRETTPIVVRENTPIVQPREMTPIGMTRTTVTPMPVVPAPMTTNIPQRDVPVSRPVPTANSPLQTVTPAGTTVLAGPPAYRWYGYGGTTPGSNAFAPSGQYPRASANWYSLTGATPGAFPVPVTNQSPTGPGVDPPTYRPPQATRITTMPPESVIQAPYTPPTVMTPTPVPVSMTSAAPSLSPAKPVVTATPSPTLAPRPATPAPLPTPIASTAKTTIPTPNSEPLRMPALPAPPTPSSQPASVPLLPKLPDVPISALPIPQKALAVVDTNTVGVLPSIPDVTIPIVPTPAPAVASLPAGAPAPLPLLTVTPIEPVTKASDSVTPIAEERPWQTTPEKVESGEGWMPTEIMPKQQSRTNEVDVKWRSEAGAPSRTMVVRAQASEQDPQQTKVSAFIQSILNGRANGIEVRWTGSQRLTVCFEVPSSRDGGQLVKELSARPELAPFQIDFCVLVK